MSTFSAVIVENSPETRAEMARLGVVLTPKDGYSMVAVRAADFAGEAMSLASSISTRVSSPVLGIAMQTSVDVYAIEEHHRGTRTRSLVYGRDTGGWEPAQGERRPWEAKLFFSQPRARWKEELEDSDWSQADVEAALGAFDAYDVTKLAKLPRMTAAGFSAFLHHGLGLPPEAAGVIDRRGWLAKLLRFG